MSRSNAFRSNLSLTALEDRTTPTVSVFASTDGGISFVGGRANDHLALSASATGALQHNLAGIGGLESATDVNSALRGTQEVNVAELTSLHINLGGGFDTVSLSGVAAPGSVAAEQLLVSLAGTGATFVLTDTGMTHNGQFASLSDVTQVSVQGTAGDDTIDASAYTAHGIDVVAGSGHNVVFGTLHADRISVGNGAGFNTFYGRGGDDILTGGKGTDAIYGGDGNDIIDDGTPTNGNTLLHHLVGGAGDDTIVTNSWHPQSIYSADGGTDTLVAKNVHTAVVSDTSTVINNQNLTNMGFERFELHGSEFQSNTIDASGYTLGGLKIFGGAQADLIFGGAQADLIYGGAGDDVIHGGGGDDTIDAGLGADLIYGDGGNDTLVAGPNVGAPTGATDYLYGGDGDDSLYGGHGINGLFGGDGNDTIHLTKNTGMPDYADGGSGFDTLVMFNVVSATLDASPNTAFINGGMFQNFEAFDLYDTSGGAFGADESDPGR